MELESKIAHLGFIQGTINRMSGNVFLIKGWTIALVAAMTALTSDSKFSAYIAFFPILLFWWLDAYYLRQEKLYRELYKAIAASSQTTSFDMETSPFQSNVKSVICTMTTKSAMPFYGLILILLVVFISKGLFIHNPEKTNAPQTSSQPAHDSYIILTPYLSMPHSEISHRPQFYYPY
ncbi:hypothetical protein [Burkholderia cepacia]|uniref:hypothetical protein n=1 Tax=Burkholderia cepacia TaxID=292 RepID=UPI003D6716CD